MVYVVHEYFMGELFHIQVFATREAANVYVGGQKPSEWSRYEIVEQELRT